MTKRGGKDDYTVEQLSRDPVEIGLRFQTEGVGLPDPAIVSRMERACYAAEGGDTAAGAALAREIWAEYRDDIFVSTWAGQMLAKYGEREEAVEAYRAAAGIEAGSWGAYWGVGRFLLMSGLHARAVEFLEEAVRLEPHAIDAHLDLARCFTALGRTAEAQKSLIEARRLDPQAEL